MSASKLRVLIPAADIHARVREMGKQIANDYKDGGPLYLVGILKGSVVFLSDLARAIDRPVRFDFIGLSSYGKSTTSSGEVKLTKDLDASAEDANILIVEDIVDTGITLTYLLQVLRQRKPRSIRIATLLDKPERRQRPIEVAYVGFQVPNEFVVGYGLDFGEEHRNLADICILEP
jgi:hypoxanthine phosphoribosyltransferase